MSTMVKKTIFSIVAILIILFLVAVNFGPAIMEKTLNKQIDVSSYKVSDEAKALHAKLNIMDWHADTLLWNRDFLVHSDYGHVDFPRLREGNISFQMLTTVTKSPKGQNYEENTADSDQLTDLVMLQGWPRKTWDSLLERALYQSEKLDRIVEASKGTVVFIKSQADLAKQKSNKLASLSVLLGTEGSHPLEGDIKNIDTMYDAGFRMFGLTHFFDNKLGGSLHGISGKGLTDFGKEAVLRMNELEVIIDLAHASEKMAWEVTKMIERPQVVSHTGFKGACDTPRNFPDDLMQAIAAKGGLIALGFWDAAVCTPTPEGIAKSMQYGIELVGADHVALGSDWDGSTTSIPSNNIATITDAMLKIGISEEDISKVMGANSIAFLKKWLPAS
ncbi:MAG: dipeptidase [Kordiimonadaceae bacterium]|nr:dipeptidase [Kordiimonadaceae bacterium]